MRSVIAAIMDGKPSAYPSAGQWDRFTRHQSEATVLTLRVQGPVGALAVKVGAAVLAVAVPPRRRDGRLKDSRPMPSPSSRAWSREELP